MTPIDPIDDPRDPRVADYRSARDADWRRRSGLFLAESALVVRRLLTESRFRARSILATPAILDGLGDALEALPEGVVVHVAGPAVQRQLMGFNFHRGCLALAERGPDLAPDALLAAAAPLLALEDVADPENVGALFRNARAFGAAGVLLSPGAGDPLYPKAIRASAAATLSLPFARLAGWPAGLARVRAAGYTLVALTPDGECDVATLAPGSARIALLVGSEGRGLGAAARAAADLTVRVRMVPGVDSLNVAVAVGIALHRLARL